MNFEEWFDKGGLWAIDPYASESVDIERCAAQIGWMACKEEIVDILKQDIQNLDLSWESVDKRFIEKIKKL